MLRMLIVGSGSGYILKVLQTICSLLLLSFVLSDINLGLEGYGWLVSLIAVQALISMILDGWRLNVSKVIGKKSGGDSKIVYQVLILTFVQALPLALIASLFAKEITAFIGVGVEFYPAIYILSVIVILEQMCFPLEALHHATLKTWRINVISGIEVLVRTISIFVFFIEFGASIQAYLCLWMMAMAIRMIILVASASSMMSLATKEAVTSIPFYLILESLPLTYKSLSSFLVLRGGVIYANRYIGGESAAILSIVVNVIRNYFFQALVSAMRPMIIPVASGIEIATLSGVRLEKIRTILFAYQFIVMISMLPFLLTIPIWMPIWIPNVSERIYVILGLAILVFMLEIQCSPVNYLLVSQNHGKILSCYSILLSILWATVLAIVTQLAGPLDLYGLMFYILGYLVIYNGIIVDYLKSRYFPGILGKTIYGGVYAIFILAAQYLILEGSFNISIWLSFLITFITSIVLFNYFVTSNVELYKRVRGLIVVAQLLRTNITS